MNISQAALAWLYLYALLLGCGLGAVYDCLRITRVFFGVHYSRRAVERLQNLRLPFLSPHKKHRESRLLWIVVFFEDLLFCMLTGVALILLFYEANSGKFRFPAVLCVGAGFLLYRMTVGKLVMLFSEVIAFVLETAVRYVAFFLLYPIRRGSAWMQKRIRLLTERSQNTRRKRSQRRYTVAQNAKVGVDACGLLPEQMLTPKKVKRGKYVAKGNQRSKGHAKEKAVQPEPSGAGFARRAGCDVHRNICK